MHRPEQHRQIAIAVVIGAVLAGITGWTVHSYQNDSFESPLSAYVGLDRLDLEFGTPDTVEAHIAASEADRQAAIAACMEAQGFQYQSTTAAADDGETPGVVTDPTSREYAETYGFGVTTLAFSQDQVGQHLLGYTPTKVSPPEPTDPNVGTVNSLDPDQRAAYLHALTGHDIAIGDRPVTATDLAPTPDADGCQGASTQTGRADLDAFYTEFGDDLGQLRHDILTDPRATEHFDAIAACVADQQLDYVRPDELHQHWADDLQTIAATIEPGPRPASGLPHLSATARADLLELQQQETALAVAVYDCGGSPTETSNLLSRLAVDHEEHFIQTNRARLDAFNQG